MGIITRKEQIDMTVDSLVTEMVEAAENYPGVDLILYRIAVENVVTVVSFLVGVAVVSLSIAIPAILTAELLVINFPPLTAFVTDRENAREEAGVEKKHRNWGVFLNDARRALRLHAEEQTNINLCYLKVKRTTLITAGISMALLFSGQDSIVRIVTKIISPILLRLTR